ncbi:hypothetical protein BaRGS_00014626, partial [Batillaria attramentaria]
MFSRCCRLSRSMSAIELGNNCLIVSASWWTAAACASYQKPVVLVTAPNWREKSTTQSSSGRPFQWLARGETTPLGLRVKTLDRPSTQTLARCMRRLSQKECRNTMVADDTVWGWQAVGEGWWEWPERELQTPWLHGGVAG